MTWGCSSRYATEPRRPRPTSVDPAGDFPLLTVRVFLEQGDLKASGCIQPTVQRLPGRQGGLGHQLGTRPHEMRRGIADVRDLEGDSQSRADPAPDLDAVDHRHLL